jgi:hypothetical protein
MSYSQSFEWVRPLTAITVSQPELFGINKILYKSDTLYSIGFTNGAVIVQESGTVPEITPGGIFILKQDTLGNYLSHALFDGLQDIFYNYVTFDVDSENNIVVIFRLCGWMDIDPGPITTYINTFDTQCGMVVVKLKADLTMDWGYLLKHVNGTISPYDVKFDSEDNILICGSFDGTFDFDHGLEETILPDTTYFQQGFVLKLDTNGDLIWVNQITPDMESTLYNLDIDTIGNIYTAGYYKGVFPVGNQIYPNMSSFGAYKKPIVVKLSSDGIIQWGKGHEPHVGYDHYAHGITVDLDQNIVYTSTFDDLTDIDNDPMNTVLLDAPGDIALCKLNQDGNVIWATSIGDPSFINHANSLTINDQNHIYVVTNLGDFIYDGPLGSELVLCNNRDFIIFKYDENGDPIRYDRCTGEGDQFGYSLASLDSNTVFVTGNYNEEIFTQPFLFSGKASFIGKYDEIDVFMNTTEISATSEIFIYPNPNNGSFQLNQPFDKLEVELVTMDGKTILSTIVTEQQYLFDINILYSGIYFLKWRSDNLSGEIKMIRTE